MKTLLGILLFLTCSLAIVTAQTTIGIKGDKFFINGEPTYKGNVWNSYSIEGLLFNARMVQGIFDDSNPTTRELWQYPDTKQWDPDRNTNEFVAAMPDWFRHGLLAFTLNLQGGSPIGYGNKGWINSAFDETGGLRPAYFQRLERILQKSDQLGMIVILGLFYFGQDEVLTDESAVKNAVDNAIKWLFKSGHRNVIVEINNECDVKSYDHDILKPDRVHELINRVKELRHDGFRFLVGTSFKGTSIPTSNVLKSADLILLHGNGAANPAVITTMVARVKQVDGYHSMPIVFNEDDHFNFDKPENNFAAQSEPTRPGDISITG
jgi:hypothetical protein